MFVLLPREREARASDAAACFFGLCSFSLSFGAWGWLLLLLSLIKWV